MAENGNTERFVAKRPDFEIDAYDRDLGVNGPANSRNPTHSPTGRQSQTRSRGAASGSSTERTDHWVYKAYGVNGDLLYIGITSKGMPRFSEHRRKGAEWCLRVHTFQIEHHPTKEQAERREKELIRALDPEHNVTFKNNTKHALNFSWQLKAASKEEYPTFVSEMYDRLERQEQEIARLRRELEAR